MPTWLKLAIEQAGAVATFSYDAFGKRFRKGGGLTNLVNSRVVGGIIRRTSSGIN